METFSELLALCVGNSPVTGEFHSQRPVTLICAWTNSCAGDAGDLRCHRAHKADSRLAPSQWETSLQSNAVSHWLGANLESALAHYDVTVMSYQWPYQCKTQRGFSLWEYELSCNKETSQTWPSSNIVCFKTLMLMQNSHHSVDNIFKFIVLIKNCFILLQISLKCIPNGSLNDIQHWLR